MPQAIMETSKGTINLDLFDKDAPGTVKNFISLAKKGFLRRAFVPSRHR